jgi:hypothetical protein
MTVVSMSKQEFSRLEVLLRVQSGRLRVSDACTLIGLRRRQVFVCYAVSSRTVRRACCPSIGVYPEIIDCPPRFVPWRCRLCVSGMPTLARRWPWRSWRRSTAARSRARPCVVG